MEESVELKHCCPVKEYFSKDVNLVDTLEITPRVIKCKRSLQVDEVYEQLVSVKNIGMFPRSITFYTDSPEDTKLKSFNLKPYQYLMPSSTLNLVVRVTPLSKKTIRNDRRIFLESKHPNLRIEIPIIAYQKNNMSYFPSDIELPSTVPKSFTYYEFILYNSQGTPLSFAIRTLNSCLTAQVESFKIEPRDFVRVVLKLNVQNLNLSRGLMKLRFGNLSQNIAYSHEPKEISVYLSSTYIRFEETKFDREAKKKFSICNETLNTIPFSLDFNSKFQCLDEVPSDISEIDDRSSYLDPTNQENSLEDDEELNREELVRKTYAIQPKVGELSPKGCTEFDVSFHPLFENQKYGDKEVPPFELNTKIVLTSPNANMPIDSCIIVEGLIDGPEMYVSPKAIDFRKVFLGEEHCENIRITNIDGVVRCQVMFYDYTGPEMAKAYISPKQMTLNPCETGIFTLTFFSLIVGKIFFKLRFKIENGAFLIITIKAISVPVRVKTFPDIIEFGTIPFAVPQKRTVLLMNPLSVPISMQCFVEDNGSETPLVLNVDDINELPPVTIKNPIEYILFAQNEDEISAYHDFDKSELNDNLSGRHCSVSSSENLSGCSETFQKEVMDKLPELATEVIRQIKFKRVIEKQEPEAKVISEVTDKLLKLSYFEEFKKYNNYARMNWDAIPSDPIEVYFDSEIIHLSPNASHTFTFLIIPNCVGYFNRGVSLRCCPHRHPNSDDEEDPFGMIVESDLMVTKIWIEYNCRTPMISWNTEICLTDRVVYAMSITNFDIEFKNDSTVGGFLHFVVVPCCEIGSLRFRDATWKFFIPANGKQIAKCQVEFRKLGEVTLTGLVKIVGQRMGIPFHISANVLPTKVSISPNAIRKRQKVLETTVVYIYIHNLTPTVTGLKFTLRSDRHQTINPYGAQLAPTGQGIYIELKTMYPDPEIYKNTLFVDMLFGPKIEIPLTYIVDGMPIHFDPDLPKGLNIGVMLISSELDYESHNVNYSRNVRIWNDGERPYFITFSKLKVSNYKNRQCSATVVKAQIYIEPKTLLLEPGEEKCISVIAVSCQEVELSCEFLVKIIDQVNPLRVSSTRFTITAKFAPAELKWSRNDIHMIYNRTHVFKQHPQLEIIELINAIGTPIDDVYLKVCGPFKIKVLYERPYTKDIDLHMLADERKEITIALDEKRIRNETCPFLKGKIFCYANDKAQKSVSLRVDINYPDIIIVHSEIVIFTNNEEKTTEVLLENVGNLDAEYKWKKLGECTRYVEKFDDYKSLAADLLYDLIRMLELHQEDTDETDSLCERNLTLCYQKYHCQLAELKDPIGIGDIVYEIVDSLDYEHRRYKMQLSDEIADDQQSLFSDKSSRKIIQETFDQILGKLKLEDSYEVSEPSLDECAKEDHFYFYEKSGVVLGKQGSYSLLHLPAVRKGYVHIASFLLDVVGGYTHNLIVTLANLERIVEVVPNSIYIGIRPWYEIFKSKITVENTTQFKVNITVNDMPRPKVANRHHNYLINGYACILGSRIFNLKSFAQYRIVSEGIMGFSSEFVRGFHLMINDCSSSSFLLRGQGVLPILLATRSNLPRTPQSQQQNVEEYKLLQRIYYFSIFKDITIVDEEPEKAIPEEEAELEKEISFSQLSILSSSECSENEESTGISCDERIMRNWELLLNTYVIIYNNESLPHASILEQFLNMEKFINDLNQNYMKRNILQRLYRNYIQFQRKRDPKIPMNLKYFTVQPLPFEQWGYVIDMPNLKLNQFRIYHIDLQFFGPGKLIASARTAVKIPGLFVYFSVKPDSDQKFSYYRSEDKMPDFFMKRYRNMWEREMDHELDPKLLHAHSFDCEDRCKYHKRDISNKSFRDRRDVKNYYNSLNKSIYLENKHHFINCMIYSESEKNFSGTIVRVNIIIKTDSKFYTEGQVLEDYLFIDLHMGPTLPILMRGLVR